MASKKNTNHGNRCYRKILRVSYKDHVTNEEVRAKIQRAIGPHEDLLTIVKRRKLQWYGHVSRSSGLAKTTLQGTVKGEKKTRQSEEEVGGQHQGRDRPGIRQVPEGSEEHGKMEETGCKIIRGAPTTLAVKGLMMMMMMLVHQPTPKSCCPLSDSSCLLEGVYIWFVYVESVVIHFTWAHPPLSLFTPKQRVTAWETIAPNNSERKNGVPKRFYTQILHHRS